MRISRPCSSVVSYGPISSSRIGGAQLGDRVEAEPIERRLVGVDQVVVAARGS